MKRLNFVGGWAGLLILCVSPANGQLAITEVLFDPVGVNTGRQVIEIQNTGASAFVMGDSGHWLYFPPARWQFPAGVIIPAGERVKVHINRRGESTATDFYTGISGMRNLRGLGAPGDSIGLFTTNLFADPSRIADFVQWGGAGNGGEDVAVAAGIWPAGGFIDVGALREGSSIAYDGSGNAPGDWCIDGSETLGAANDSCTQSFARSPVLLNEVGYLRTGAGQYHPAVELKNVGTFYEDLGGKWIVLSGQHSYQFPLGIPETLVAPGEIVVVHLGVSGTDGLLVFHTGAGTFRDLRASDSVSFHAVSPPADPTGVLDFVQWGAAGSPIEGAAATAGHWTAGEFVDASDRRARGSLASKGVGQGKARWDVDNTGTIGKENDAHPDVAVVINEALVDPTGANLGRTQIELRNTLDESVDAAGFTLCTEHVASPGVQRCFSLPAGATLLPGGFLVVHLNRAGLSSPTSVYTGPFQDLDPTGDSYLLYLTPRVTNTNNLVDYLRWGNNSGFGEAEAAALGIWEGGAILVGAVKDGSSLSYSGWGDSPQNYRVDRTPSIGSGNTEPAREEPFRRGDCNDDFKVDISDAIYLLKFLFVGSGGTLCEDACDSNNDDAQDISDPVFVLNFLFGGGNTPPAPGPGPACAAEAVPGLLSCSSFLSCM